LFYNLTEKGPRLQKKKARDKNLSADAEKRYRKKKKKDQVFSEENPTMI